jgi:endonuclease/exonuclease/phosphatase family metal-dependent hydrolase
MAVRTYAWFMSGVFRIIAVIALLAGTAQAQSVTLPAYEDTTLQGGIYENTNFGGGDLVTRASADPTWERHALLKFDTHNTIPAGTTITSATLTVTVKGGNSETRTVTASCVPESFWEHQTTWMRRSDTLHWSQPGGTVAHDHATGSVTGAGGSKVTFDVTLLVQEALAATSRYTRVMLADRGADSKGSLRSYYSNEADSTSLRPTLVVTYGSTTTIPAPITTTPTSTSGSTLKVLHWNIASTSNVTAVADFLAGFSPDVVSLNEVYKYSSDNRPQKIADLLSVRTGLTWYYHWAQKGGASSGEGEVVLSRYPIEDVESHLLSYNRSAALIRVTVNGRPVHVVSTHLDHQYSSRRLTQVKELKAWLTSFAEQRIVAGDFNWYPGTTEINEMAKDYSDAWKVAKSEGTATSTADNPDGNTRNTRIDYVFYSKGASGLKLLSARTTERISISDHRAVLAVFQVN